MFFFDRESCELFVDDFMAAPDAERPSRLWDVCQVAVRENAPAYPIIVGHVFRDRRLFDWAEYIFQLALPIPGARFSAMYELAFVEQHRARPQGAVDWLAKLEAEQPLEAIHQRMFAHQLGHLGRIAEATERLEKALLLDPGSMETCVSIRQYIDYYNEYPRDEALRRSEALTRVYRTKSTAEVYEEIMDALRNRRPYSMVRVNDGEGGFIHLSVDDEARYAALYRVNRVNWHHIIFGDDKLLYDRDFIAVTREFTDRLREADCIGAHHYWSLQSEYAWGSTRNVPCIFNIVRKLELMHERGEVDPGAVTLCNPQINQHLLFDGYLEPSIKSQTRIGLISAHPGLQSALKERFDLSEVIYHRTPGEAMVHSGLEKEPIASWHGRISHELKQVEPGMLYLVCAGLFSKLYCQMIKDAGGIGLDIGAGGDIWVRAPTRGHHALPEVRAHGLIET